MKAKNFKQQPVAEQNENQVDTVRFLENQETETRPPEPVPVGQHETAQGFTIGKKLTVAFGVLLICWGIAGFFSMVELKELEKNLSEITEVTEPLSAQAYEMEITFLQSYVALLSYFRDREAANLENFRDEREKFENHRRKFVALADSESMKTMELRMESEYQKFRQLADEMLRLEEASPAVPLEASKQKSMQELARIREEMDRILDQDIQTITHERLTNAKNQAQKEIQNSFKVNLILLISGIMIGIAGAFGITKNILSRLQVVMTGVRRISESKDLTQPISLTSGDEMGLLGRMFNAMRQSLYDVIVRIQQASLKINSSSNEILAASTQHEAASAEQSSQMNQIQATLTEAAATATQLNQNAQEVVRYSQEISREAEEGGRFIEGTNVKMKAMSESNQTVGLKLKTLNEKIEGIGKILSTILSVSDQTNLLSLNAAIEAAKAGEHGKGFSVVAQEIRRLADQTAQSSQEISNIVNEVQAASSSAIMVMEKSAQDVADSTHVVGELGDRFSRITGQVQNILPQIEQISQSIGQLAVGNKEVSASVTEMNKALKLTLEAAKQLRQAAYDLTSMGQQLRGAVGQFRLK